MDDQALARKKYQEFLREQKRLEREMQRIDKEEWGITSMQIPREQEYQKLPELPPIELIVMSEEETQNRDKGKGKAYQASLYKQPKRRGYKRRDTYYDNYWEENPDPDKDPDWEEKQRKRRNQSSQNYYARNKDKCKQLHKAWLSKEENKAKQREYYREYMRKRKAKQIEEEEKKHINIISPDIPKVDGDWHIRHPSVFRSVITANGCNTCGGGKEALYLFRNDNNEYTGCLCQKCLTTYKYMKDKDSDWILKVRDYVRSRHRETHERPPKK